MCGAVKSDADHAAERRKKALDFTACEDTEPPDATRPTDPRSSGQHVSLALARSSLVERVVQPAAFAPRARTNDQLGDVNQFRNSIRSLPTRYCCSTVNFPLQQFDAMHRALQSYVGQRCPWSMNCRTPIVRQDDVFVESVTVSSQSGIAGRCG
jgi:hypothetical protein